ncbi:uncharacterized protein M8220_016509 [Acridotheres tristis]
MGAKLSVQQREIYNQVVGTLVGGKKSFSKGSLKKFVRWLTLHFPEVSPQSVKTVPFWDAVGLRLSELGAQGDYSVGKLIVLFFTIRSVLKENKGVDSKPKRTSPVYPVSPSPFPDPSIPTPGDLGGAARQRSQASLARETSHCSPGPPQAPQFPSPGSKGPAARDPFLNPSALKPFSPVSPVITPVPSPVFTPILAPAPTPGPTLASYPEPRNGAPIPGVQEGIDHVAWSSPCAPPPGPSLSSPSAPSLDPYPSPFPSPVTTLCPFPMSESTQLCHSAPPPAGPSCCDPEGGSSREEQERAELSAASCEEENEAGCQGDSGEDVYWRRQRIQEWDPHPPLGLALADNIHRSQPGPILKDVKVASLRRRRRSSI